MFSEYLCSPEANIYDIDFVRFKIRDWESGTVLFEIAKPTVPPGTVLMKLLSVTDVSSKKIVLKAWVQVRVVVVNRGML